MSFQVLPLEEVCPGTQHVSRRSFKELMISTELGDVYETAVEPRLLQYLTMTQFDALIPKYRVAFTRFLAYPDSYYSRNLTADMKMTIDMIYSCGVNPYSLSQLRWALVKGPWPWGSEPTWLHTEVILLTLNDIHDAVPNLDDFQEDMYVGDLLDRAWDGLFVCDRLPVCRGCLRFPHEIHEYVRAVSPVVQEMEQNLVLDNSDVAAGVGAAIYVSENNGTFNPQHRIFWCTACYIRAGMPLGQAQLPYDE